ncbi:MAG: leucine-rich repeat protein [Clostridiales bacterium]|nr:leucine-rich repeat protein [Clostridiales bacterium]
MSSTYVSSSNTATLANTNTGTSEKLYVPAGTWTFTLVENSDGTVTLSYAEPSGAAEETTTEAEAASTLKITSTSNMFDTASVEYNEDTSQFTVSYIVQSAEKDMLNIQWRLYYQDDVLQVADSTNKTNVIPAVGNNGTEMTKTYDTEALAGYEISESAPEEGWDRVKACAANTHLYDITSAPVSICTVTFDVVDPTATETEIIFLVDVFGVSLADDDENTISAEEEYLVNSSNGSFIVYPDIVAANLTSMETVFDPETDVTETTTTEVTVETTTEAEEVSNYYLVGSINGEDYGCEADYENMGDYGFSSDGTVTATFTADSYVFVKENNNANWYMTDGWLGTTTTATLYNTSVLGEDADKLYVPAGTWTFTLVNNGDDTFTLSYLGEEAGTTDPTDPTDPTTGESEYTYKVLADGTAEITGYSGSDTEIEIPSEIDGYIISGIGNSAFVNSTSLTSVTIPDGVTSIGAFAFYSCTNLEEVIIPASVTEIDSQAFYNCKNLTVYGYTGTTAEAYANENGITFVALDASSVLIGDVDLDGNITVADATAIQKFVVGTLSLSDEQFKAADANGDGSVTVADATTVQKMAVGAG